MTQSVPDVWFDAEWWPLEAAIIWVAKGDKMWASHVGDLIHRARDGEITRLKSLGSYEIVLNQGLAHDIESIDGARYRVEARESGYIDPFNRAQKKVVSVMLGRRAMGRPGSTGRTPIPSEAWRGGQIIRDRKLGYVLMSGKTTGGVRWHDIDVHAAIFRVQFKPKLGRGPAQVEYQGKLTATAKVAFRRRRELSSPQAKRATNDTIAEETGTSSATAGRVTRKIRKSAAEKGDAKAQRDRKGGRPKGAGDRH